MANGVRVVAGSLEVARGRAAAQRAALAPEWRLLDAPAYPVGLGVELASLTERLTGELHRRTAAPGAA